MSPEEVARLERELEAVEQDLRLIADTHGKTAVQLVIVVGYLRKLLDNTAVQRHMTKRYPDIVAEFRKIIEATDLERNT